MHYIHRRRANCDRLAVGTGCARRGLILGLCSRQAEKRPPWIHTLTVLPPESARHFLRLYSLLMSESHADAFADLLKIEAEGWALWNPYHEGVVGDCGLLTEGRFVKASLRRLVDG